MNDDLLKTPLVFESTHFNWSNSGKVFQAPAQVTICESSLTFLIYPGQEHSMEFPIPFAANDAPQRISELIINQGHKLLSILCVDSTFSGNDISTTESTALIGTIGRSAERLALVLFVLDPNGQEIQIENHDFYTLRIESSKNGFNAYQEASSSGGCQLDLFNVCNCFSSEAMKIELNVDNSSPTLSYDQSKIEINSKYSLREILEFVTEEDQFVIVLFCGNYFALDDRSLDDLGSLTLLATSRAGEFVMIAATADCQGKLRDREGFVYHLSFDESGFSCEQEDEDDLDF